MTHNETAVQTIGQTPETPSPAAPAKVRRVGTFTFGVTLVVSGLGMLAALFFPNLDLSVLMKLSPAALVLLGAEVLVSTRHSEKLKYDWLGMLFCFLVVCGALCVFSLAWAMAHYPEFYHW